MIGRLQGERAFFRMLNLKQLLSAPGAKLSVCKEPDFSASSVGEDCKFSSTVLINGEVQNRAGALEFSYKSDFELSFNCHRCGEKATVSRTESFFHVLAESVSKEQNEDSIVLLKDGMLDLEVLAQEDILLSLPTKLLCADECKGICPQCGQNLNKKDCTCVKNVVDSRLESLRELLK